MYFLRSIIRPRNEYRQFSHPYSTFADSHYPLMEALDDYFLLDMLSRLDVKTIIYCKCVCKRWRDLVLDPHFVSNLHLPRSLSSPPSLIIHGLPRENLNDVNTYGGHGSRGEVSVGRPGYLNWVEMQQ